MKILIVLAIMLLVVTTNGKVKAKCNIFGCKRMIYADPEIPERFLVNSSEHRTNTTCNIFGCTPSDQRFTIMNSTEDRANQTEIKTKRWV